nr:P1 family peptidase [Elusimicrobiales bacterium]
MTKNESRNLRCRELGINIGQYPSGRWNAVTDVKGVRVGHETVVHGSGKLRPGKGPARTGVTVLMPCGGDIWRAKLPSGVYILNGNGEATGLMWVHESGILETPIAFTNSLSVGTVHRALV